MRSHLFEPKWFREPSLTIGPLSVAGPRITESQRPNSSTSTFPEYGTLWYHYRTLLALSPDLSRTLRLHCGGKTVKNRLGIAALLVFACVFLLDISSVSAQGRGGGRGQGGGPPAGNPSAGRQPAGVGVDRGISTSSDRSNGRADTGRATASGNSNGRSDVGLERARLQRENAQRADKELNDHPQMAPRLQTTANNLRSGYQSALLTNPKLNFGNYVAATRLATNLGRRNPNITRDAILSGFADGNSIGRTLQNLGLSEQQANDAKKNVEREIKEAKRP
jgi:hypothetical protein